MNTDDRVCRFRVNILEFRMVPLTVATVVGHSGPSSVPILLLKQELQDFYPVNMTAVYYSRSSLVDRSWYVDFSGFYFERNLSLVREFWQKSNHFYPRCYACSI